MKRFVFTLFVLCVWTGGGILAQEKSQEKQYKLNDFSAHSDSLSQLSGMQDSLPEISIVAAKRLIKAEVDKTSYNIEDDPDSKTYTLLEMLRKVPLVTVDGDDNIKVNGSGSFKVYMNGKPSNMITGNPKEVLRSIPANSIVKIEVITDPGARYDAEGVSGVLNIITKRGEFEGYSANLNTTIMNKVQMGSGFASFKYGKLSLSANYTYSNYQEKMKTDYYRRQPGNPEEENLYRYSDQKVNTPGHYGSLEASFEIDSLNLITLSGALDNNYNRIRSSDFYQMKNTDYDPVYSYNQFLKEKEEWGHNSVKVDYQHMSKRNRREMLTFSYQYDHTPNDVNRELFLTDKEGESPSLQYLNNFTRQLNNAKGQEHTLQLDYVNPFSSKHNLEGGIKYIRRNNISHATSEMRETATDDWQSSAFQPLVEYNHTQNIMAAYGGYTFKSGPLSINGGLRMEHTWQDVDYKQGSGADFNYQATDWVPNLSTSWKLTDGQQLRFSYNIRLRRPGIGYLNPYVLLSGTNISYGNPELTSEKHHRFNLAYSYFSSKFNLQLTGLYTMSGKDIGEYQFLDKEGILNKTYGNIGIIRGGGISTYIGYNPTAKTFLSVNGMLHYLDIRAEKAYKEMLDGIKNQGFCGSVFVNVSQQFKYGWRFVVSAGTAKPEMTIGTTSPLYYFYGTSLVKTFLNDKLSVSLRAQNFAQPYQTIKSNDVYTGFHTTEKSKIYGRTFGLTVSYRFGSLKESVKKVVRSIENDDVKNSDK